MGDLSQHFNRREFECQCGCGMNNIDMEVVKLCEIVRKLNGNKPITISSGCRCSTSNFDVGGEKKSMHLLGKAADILVDNPKYIFDELNKLYPNSLGLGLYRNRVHVDIRDVKFRWGK